MAAAAPYILLAAGTAANYAGQRQQQREQRAILNRAMQDTKATQDKGAQMVLDQATKDFSPAARQQALADQAAQIYAQSQKDLGGQADQGGVGAIIDTAGGAGNVSTDFVKAKTDKALSEGNRLMDVAREAAKYRSTNALQTEEGQNVADLTGRLADLYGSNRAMAQARQLDVQNVDEPLYGKLGKVAAAVGSIWAAGAGGAGAGAGGAGANYSLAGSGAQLGEKAAPGFWGSAGSRIRFG